MISTAQRTRTFVKFMVHNGILTITTTLIIVLAIRAILQVENRSWQDDTPIFLFVLMITTLFFFIIFWQSRKLRSEQELFSNVFMHSPDGVLVTDNTLNIIRMNPTAKHLLHWAEEPASVSFCNHCSNYPGLNKRCSYQNCFITEPASQHTEVLITTSDGITKSMNASVSHYTDPVLGPLNIIRLQAVEKNRQEEQHRIAQMITHSILSAQENERKRISRELHDGIGQSLYSILIQTEVLKGQLEEPVNTPADESIDSLQESIRHTIEDIRDLSVELRPSALDDIGLVAALRNYVKLYGQKFGIQVLFSIDGDSGRLPAGHEIALYRIVQEALTNAAKYSHTEVVNVGLKLLPEAAELLIRDHGVGFELTTELRQGVGLYSMEERVKILGGEFEIESVPGQGTTIQVRVPIEADEISGRKEDLRSDGY
ncbi:sensor histidine kinase [Paenibacillus apis]|uniref:histidine kinase n=1 Tax=Paenibacillus apis TaxID=1792174 RepID=A0A919Y6J0_9BACL|nr:histidine kinase [Paenibacillus apis]GIO44714.1 sensor histidine kinase [Paenibacillus apis]